MSRGPQRRRWKPYTYTGVSRVPCQRCGAPSSQQWQVCADFSSFRAICWPCDVEMNREVLRFMRFPNADEMTEAYRKRMERAHPDLRDSGSRSQSRDAKQARAVRPTERPSPKTNQSQDHDQPM